MDYSYSQTWFFGSEIQRFLLNYINPGCRNTVLEIGCFEGLSSVFFADNILDHPESTLTCVDPFLSITNNDHQDYLKNNEEQNFDYNVSICKNNTKLDVIKTTSDIFFETNEIFYNFIYIDGCHECDYIKRDLENSFRFLEPDGIMWMDDYLGGDSIRIKRVMDNFLETYSNQLTVIHKGYQLAIKKV